MTRHSLFAKLTAFMLRMTVPALANVSAFAVDECCTPVATATIVQNVGKHDVLGIKLGMPAL
jgi:hypothetical protein